MRTLKELLEDSVEQMKHIHSVNTNGRLYATTESLIKEIQQALNIPDVIESCDNCMYFPKCSGDPNFINKRCKTYKHVL